MGLLGGGRWSAQKWKRHQVIKKLEIDRYARWAVNYHFPTVGVMVYRGVNLWGYESMFGTDLWKWILKLYFNEFADFSYFI